MHAQFFEHRSRMERSGPALAQRWSEVKMDTKEYGAICSIGQAKVQFKLKVLLWWQGIVGLQQLGHHHLQLGVEHFQCLCLGLLLGG